MSKPEKDNEPSLAALTPPVQTPRPDGSSASRGAEIETPAPFLPGQVFAGRYRMITRIGRGGMGEVWRADDLVLQTPIALKLIYSTTLDARERVLKEVRLARQITHPAVCRVFDVGEAEGQVFFSMELVQGEDLATLLRRAGRLPQEKVLEVARHLCGGLAAAHAQHVLHRDLKPANVLVDENGSVRITDFGIAIVRSESGSHSFIGTPDYMAPEQLTAGSRLSEQTDLYALGLVLYELLVGERPFPDGPESKPIAPSLRVPDVHPLLERVILQALAPSPRDRPPSAASMAARLPAHAGRSVQPTIKPWIAGAALAGAIALLAVVSSVFLARGGRALTDQDTIVLAEFENTTGEPVFNGALKVALAVALEQSPFLKVFPDEGVRERLRLMQRSPDERVTRSVARDIAQRERLKALVAGSIGMLGSHFVVALEAINSESGDVMAREQVEVESKEQVLSSLGSVASQLREKLGESLASIQRFDVPLARATTPSLEALQAYSLALDEGRVAPRVEAIPHLRRAIELDPEFALAHAALSGVYANIGQTADAPPFSRRAYELRDRVSERERFFISWRYYIDAEQSWEKALELGLLWTTTYPREAFAFNSLGLASAAFGQHERAVDAFREAIRLDPKFVPPHRNLVGSLVALDRFDEARSLLREVTAGGITSIGLRQLGYLLAFVEGDAQTMAQELRPAGGAQDVMWSLNSEARTEAFAGRFARAHDLFQRSVEAAAKGNFRELGARWTLEDAESHAVAGQCGEAQREVAAGLALSRDNFTLERAGRSLALCGEAADPSRISSELSTRFSSATLTARIQLPVMAAGLALRRGDPESALQVLEPVKPYDHAPAAEFWPSFLRGQAYLQLKDGSRSKEEFQRVVDHRGEAPHSPLYPLAHLGLARAATLTGDTAGARAFYEKFLSFWSGADGSVQAVKEARQEYAGLQ